MKAQDMTQRYRKFKRSWGTWYAFDNATDNSVSLKTRVKAEAEQKVNRIWRNISSPPRPFGITKSNMTKWNGLPVDMAK